MNAHKKAEELLALIESLIDSKSDAEIGTKIQDFFWGLVEFETDTPRPVDFWRSPASELIKILDLGQAKRSLPKYVQDKIRETSEKNREPLMVSKSTGVVFGARMVMRNLMLFSKEDSIKKFAARVLHIVEVPGATIAPFMDDMRKLGDDK